MWLYLAVLILRWECSLGSLGAQQDHVAALAFGWLAPAESCSIALSARPREIVMARVGALTMATYSRFRRAATATAWARVSTPSFLKMEVR